MMFEMGFRFKPSDEKLIEGYLLPWVKGEKPLWDGIVEKQIYGENEPWKLFSDIESANHSKSLEEEEEEMGEITYTIHAYTTLLRDSNSKTVSRRAGNGTWVEQTGPEEIVNYDIGCIIGHSKMLAYEHSGEGTPDIGHWRMIEYSLSDESVKKSGRSNAADLVVCKITKSFKKKLIDDAPVDEEGKV